MSEKKVRNATEVTVKTVIYLQATTLAVIVKRSAVASFRS